MGKVMYVWSVIIILFCGAYGDLQGDEIECSSSLMDLGACIGFLEGMGTQPSSDCCSNVQKVRSSNPRCLCLLIKDISHPSFGLSLNQTLILQMPILCQVTDKLSECIDILKLTPSSPDAKIFEMGNAPSPSSFAGLSPSDSPSGGLSPADSPSGGLSPSDSPSGGLSPADSPSGGLSPADSPSGGLSPADSTSGGLSPADSLSGGLSPPHSPSGVFQSNSNWSYEVQPYIWFSGFVVLAALWFNSFQL